MPAFAARLEMLAVGAQSTTKKHSATNAKA
jgi:hypothetical protein